MNNKRIIRIIEYSFVGIVLLSLGYTFLQDRMEKYNLAKPQNSNIAYDSIYNNTKADTISQAIQYLDSIDSNNNKIEREARHYRNNTIKLQDSILKVQKMLQTEHYELLKEKEKLSKFNKVMTRAPKEPELERYESQPEKMIYIPDTMEYKLKTDSIQ